MNPTLQNDLLEKARQASRGSGVYRMLDKQRAILYVGKAKNLYARLLSYFQLSANHDPKTQILVKKIVDFDTILTDSEAEALILECILIKRHKPRYNVLLKDDKSYPYLVIDRSHSFPKIIYTRRPQKCKNLEIFGPYVSAVSLRQVMRSLNHTFKLRDCMDTEFANRSRACINYQIGLCSGPCVRHISQEEYVADVDKAVQILRGHAKDLLKHLHNEMDRQSEDTEYEKAAELRDQITALEETLQTGKQKIAFHNSHHSDNRDVIGFYCQDGAAGIAVLFIRNDELIESKCFHFDDVKENTKEELLQTFLAQFYLYDQSAIEEHMPQEMGIPGVELKIPPQEVLLPFAIEDANLLQESLLRYKVKTEFVVPQRGKKLELLQLAEKNAKQALEERALEKTNVYRTLTDLKMRLHLDNYPRHIECFDISNLGNTGIVASRVSFIEGKPEKSLYRHYKIRSTSSQNDFAAMEEVLTRSLISERKRDHNADMPDLIIVDGGKGQLSMAVEVFRELNLTGIDLIALAKSKTESNFQGREVEKSPERVFKPGQMNPIALAAHSPLCHLLERIRNEAHRFALQLQHKQRGL